MASTIRIGERLRRPAAALIVMATWIALSCGESVGTDTERAARAEPTPSIPTPPTYVQDWVLLFWMPYDNDLAGFGPEVLAQLERAPGSDSVAWAIQSDLPAIGDMRRRWRLGSGPVQSRAVAGEDSASAASLAEFLTWAGRTFESRRYAVIVLDHGGGVPHVSLDERPGRTEPTDEAIAAWMQLPQLASALRGFREAEAGELELVFLQVCVKATIETAYELREATPRVLASQLPIVAPNAYYEATLADLGRDPEMDGSALARSIARNDDPSMYASYSLIDTRSVASIVARLEAASPAGADTPRADDAYVYWTDRYMDVVTWSESAAGGDEDGATLRDLVGRGVEVFPAPADRRLDTRPDPDGLSGLSLHVPADGRLLPGYDAMAIYRETELDERLAERARGQAL